MKRAWEIAKNAFYKTALESIVGKAYFSKKLIRDICRYNLRNKRDFFEMEHVQAVMDIDFTIRDFFAESLKLAWKEVKKAEEKEQEKIAQETETEKKEIAQKNLAKEIEIVNKNAPRRELVPAGKYSVGQKLYGFIITGIGRSFRPHADMFSMGITPDTEEVEYAYFN